MKKFILSFLSAVLSLAAFSATAQFSATVTWDKPGSIKVLKGSSPNYATPVDIAGDATSYEVTEKEEYIFIPADGYFIETATMDGANQTLTRNYSDGGYYYKLPAKYQSTKFNGKTVALVVAEYVYDREFTLDIDNGADKITFQLQDKNGGLTRTITPADGSQVYKLSQNDYQLYMKASGYPAPALHTATINNKPVTQQTNGSYLVVLEDKATVDVALNDPAEAIAQCDVKFVFTHNNPECLNNMRNWSLSKFIYPADLEASDYTLKLDAGTKLAINIKTDDYKLNSITADPAVEVSGDIASGTQFVIKESTTITIDAEAIAFETLTAKLYTNNAEGLIVTQVYGDESTALTLTPGEEHAASSVTFDKVGFTIPEATTEYTVENISGKLKRFFFAAKPGYFINDGAFGGRAKAAGDPADYYKLSGATMATVDECPLYISASKIDYNTKAVIYFEGSDDCTARVTSMTSQGDDASYLGQTTSVAKGYTEITFDPVYNAVFSARFLVSSAQAENYYVYADGVAVKASSDSETVFPGIKLNENSVLKLFYGSTAPAVRTLNFTVDEGAEASLSYDKYIITSDFSKPIVNAGDVEYTFAPAAGTVILVNDVELEAPYKFTPKDEMTAIRLVKEAPVLEYTTTPANGATVKQLSKLVLNIVPTDAMFTGEESFAVEEDFAKYIKVTKGDQTYDIAGVEDPEMSETAISLPVLLAEPITESGQYTVEIAKGFIYTTKLDKDYNYVRQPDSAISGANTLTVTVDPNYQYKWVFTPENGSKNPQPDAEEEYQFVYLSLPEAESLDSEPFDTEGAVGPWIKFNDKPLKRTTDDQEGQWQFIPDWNLWGQPVLRIAINADVFKLPGTLVISAEEGAFTVNGSEPSPALEYSAQIGEKKDYTVVFDPASGTVAAEDLATIKLTFEEAQSLELNDNSFYALFAQGWTYGIELREDNMTIDGNTVTIALPEDFVIKPGNYTLSMDEGSFIVDGNQLSPAINANYQVVRSTPVSFEWVPSPSGAVVNYGYGLEVAFGFDDVETVRVLDRSAIVVEFNGEKLSYIDYSDPNVGKTIAYSINTGSDFPNILMVSVQGGEINNVETTGTLKVTIPAGALAVSGEATPEVITHSWEFIKAKEYEVATTPANGATVKEITTVTVEFTNAESAELYQQNSIELRKTDYSYYESAASVEEVADAEHPTFIVTFATAATADGEYNFNMYDGAFTLDGVQGSPSVKVVIKVDHTVGIDDIFGDDAEGSYTVVNLLGTVLLKDASLQEVKALPAGFYIINGKKIAIK